MRQVSHHNAGEINRNRSYLEQREMIIYASIDNHGPVVVFLKVPLNVHQGDKGRGSCTDRKTMFQYHLFSTEIIYMSIIITMLSKIIM